MARIGLFTLAALFGAALVTIGCADTSASGETDAETDTATGGATQTDPSTVASGPTGTTTAQSSTASSASSSVTSATTAPSGDTEPKIATETGSTGGESWPPLCESDAMFPVDGWPTGDPEDHNLDAATLDFAAFVASTNESQCLLVVKDGTLVFERYFLVADEHSRLRTWSIAKSYTATAVGIALDRGDLGSIDDSIALYLPELVGTDKESITLRHLLDMTAGLYPGVLEDMAGMFLAEDMTQMALDTELAHEPGTEWHYSNIAVQMFDPILRAATGMTAEEYLTEHLWGPMGVDAEWDRDMAGNPSLLGEGRQEVHDQAVQTVLEAVR